MRDSDDEAFGPRQGRGRSGSRRRDYLDVGGRRDDDDADETDGRTADSGTPGADDRDTLQGVTDGHIFGTVVQQPYEFGYQSVKILAALARGEDAGATPVGVGPPARAGRTSTRRGRG